MRARARPAGERAPALRFELGFTLSERDRDNIVRGKDFVQIGAGPFDVDLVFAPDGIESYEQAARDAEYIGGFPVMRIRDIIASKRAAGRKKELADLDLLEAFREVYEAGGRRAKP